MEGGDGWEGGGTEWRCLSVGGYEERNRRGDGGEGGEKDEGEGEGRVHRGVEDGRGRMGRERGDGGRWRVGKWRRGRWRGVEGGNIRERWGHERFKVARRRERRKNSGVVLGRLGLVAVG